MQFQKSKSLNSLPDLVRKIAFNACMICLNQTDLNDECGSTEETVTDIINETINDTVNKLKEEENIIKNLGFEPIF